MIAGSAWMSRLGQLWPHPDGPSMSLPRLSGLIAGHHRACLCIFLFSSIEASQ